MNGHRVYQDISKKQSDRPNLQGILHAIKMHQNVQVAAIKKTIKGTIIKGVTYHNEQFHLKIHNGKYSLLVFNEYKSFTQLTLSKEVVLNDLYCGIGNNVDVTI
jgi:hypothetical protein